MPAPAARFRHAFIVTYGRSGSTLLQGMLNALPGYLIRGENYDMLRHLEPLFHRLPRFGQERAEDLPGGEPGTKAPKDPFFGFEAFNDGEIAAAIAALVDHLLLRDTDAATIRCLGFKEIRYTPETVVKRVDFLRRLFPGCAVLYNIRDPDRVVQSEFQKDKEVGYFAAFNEQIATLAASDPHAFLVRYEDVARGDGTLIGLHEFLGERFNPLSVDAVLSVRHSYSKLAAGQFYSNFPRRVEVVRDLRGISMLVVDRFDVQGDAVRMGGLLMGDGSDARRFEALLDEQGRSKQFRAVYDIASPALAKRLGNEAAAAARFEFAFMRGGGSDEYRIMLDGNELAISVRAPRTAD